MLPHPTPPRTPWTVKKPFRDEHTKKWRYSLEVFLKWPAPSLIRPHPLKWQSHSYILKRNGPEQTKLSAVIESLKPANQKSSSGFPVIWLVEMWNLYSVAKSCCPLVVNKIYTHVCSIRKQILCEERHLTPTHCLVTVVTLEPDFLFTLTFIYAFLSPQVISLTLNNNIR